MPPWSSTSIQATDLELRQSLEQLDVHETEHTCFSLEDHVLLGGFSLLYDFSVKLTMAEFVEDTCYFPMH